MENETTQEEDQKEEQTTSNQSREIGALSPGIISMLMKNRGERNSMEGNIIGAAADGKEVKTILVSSNNHSEGKTMAAVSMAYTLSADANAKVLLIDGNLHSPKIHEHFNIGAQPGLADLMVTDIKNSDVVRRTEDKNLFIMPSGMEVENSLDVFRSKKFKAKLDFFKKKFDYIILDGHSVGASSDSTTIAKYFDGTILVVECEKTRFEVVEEAKKKINQVGGLLIGIVLNKRKFYIPRALYGWV